MSKLVELYDFLYSALSFDSKRQWQRRRILRRIYERSKNEVFIPASSVYASSPSTKPLNEEFPGIDDTVFEIDMRYLYQKGFIKVGGNDGEQLPNDLPGLVNIAAGGIDEIENGWLKKHFSTIMSVIAVLISIAALIVSALTSSS